MQPDAKESPTERELDPDAHETFDDDDAPTVRVPMHRAPKREEGVSSEQRPPADA